MGTFHQNKHEYHGITVVVDMTGPEVYIGRCEDIVGEQIFLLDVDVHREEDGGATKDEYVRKAARFGIWPKHPKLTLPVESVRSVKPLGAFAEE